jgi:adenosylhomocysteine nucleosidase
VESAKPVLAVTCLAFEARLAAGMGVHVVSVAGAQGLAAHIEAAIVSAGCCGVLSFGVAGGLDPALSPGDWVVASSIVSESGRFCVDPTWSRALLARLPGAVQADICGVNEPLPDSAAKLALRRKHGSAAVDTESHIAASVAARAGLPFAAVRVVLDPAWRSLPPAALVPLRPGGAPDLGNVFRSVWRTPSQLWGLLKITADAGRALAALAQGRALLGDRLGFAPPAIAETEPSPATGLLAHAAADASGLTCSGDDIVLGEGGVSVDVAPV